MDISEPTTISQESFGLSPECDIKSAAIIHSDSMDLMAMNGITTNAMFMAPTNDKIAVNNALNNRSSTSNRLYTNAAKQYDNKNDNSSLDNRLTTCTNRTKNVNTKQRTDLTLVDTHPLMPDRQTDDGGDDEISPDSPAIIRDAFAKITGQSNIPHIEPEVEMTSSTSQADVSDAKRSSIMSSGESEPDISQYQASVEPTYQAVSMTNHNPGSSGLTVPKHNNLRKISLTSELRTEIDDNSSIETMSNNSSDGDDSDINDDFNSIAGRNNDRHLRNKSANEQAQASASIAGPHACNDSGKDSMPTAVTLSDGQTRDIDMKVIEPYKRCLSHGGYIQSPGNNAIVIFSACYLPDRSRADYNYVMENLFLYVVKTLEQFVTEDYILIYLHGGSTRSTLPPLPWLKKCYNLLDRRIRKSLKNLYMVHPTFWLKSIVWMARPFISSKFWRKLVYIRTLSDLYEQIPVEKAAVPDKVKVYDKRHS